MMEWYTLASLGTMTALIGLLGFRLAKDEWLLRRKGLMIGKNTKFFLQPRQCSNKVQYLS
jgi:hypothetical protein